MFSFDLLISYLKINKVNKLDVMNVYLQIIPVATQITSAISKREKLSGTFNKFLIVTSDSFSQMVKVVSYLSESTAKGWREGMK